LKAIIHIGMEKAGSTSMQKYLYLNKDKLKGNGICCSQTTEHCFYPKNYRSAKLLDLMLPKRDETRLREALGINNKPNDIALLHDEICQMLTQEVQEASGEVGIMVFSDESFISELCHDGWVASLYEFLSGLFDEVIVFCYVRRQDQWLSSSFSEILRRGFAPIDLFNLTTSDVFLKKRRLLEYHNRYKQWSKYFGEANVIFKPFLKENFYSHNLVADFCHTLDLPFFEGKEEFQENVSINVDGQLILLAANKLLENKQLDASTQKKCVAYLNQHYTGKGFVPDDKQIKVIKNYYQPQNAFLNEAGFVIPDVTDSSRHLSKDHLRMVSSGSYQKDVLKFIKDRRLS
jgi:hypothetical protein